jgi:hypothetical protein
MLRLLVVGRKGHGKDAVARVFSERLGQPYRPATLEFLELQGDNFLRSMGFKDVEEAYKRRDEYRELLYEMMNVYNEEVPYKLLDHVLCKSGIYTGLRNKEHLLPAQEDNIIDLTVWVDATERLGWGEEPMTILPEMADEVIVNNGTEEELVERVNLLINSLGF